MRNILSCFTIVLLCFGLLPVLTAQTDLPKVIPPSPEVSGLFRYQDYPMDYSTGLPQINIPLYEVKSGTLSVPISISYHASGRRVSDQDGPVALGWTLNAGGIISRTIYGTPDFETIKFPSPFRTSGISSSSDIEYLEKIIHYDYEAANIKPFTESEYDIFSYSLPGGSGKFVFRDNNNVKTPVLIPAKPFIVTPYSNTGGLTNIDVKDDKGVLYSFGQPEYGGPDNDNALTALSLVRMISADKTDTITFEYDGFAQWLSAYSQTGTYIDSWGFAHETEPSYPDRVTNNESTSYGVYQIKRLTRINFKQGTVNFNLVSGSDKIDNIQIKDINGIVIKTIQFARTQMDRLKQGGSALNPNASQVNNKLDAVIFKDRSDVGVENYAFEYYPTQYYGSESTIDLHYCDWWGYYNISGKIGMIPYYTLQNGVHFGNPDANREPDENGLKSGVLKKITYPTGGNTIFSYESNRYSGALGNKAGPGLRVSKVESTDNKGVTTIKSYKYGVNESGLGFLDLEPSLNTMATHLDYMYSTNGAFFPYRDGSYGQYTFTSGFSSSLSALASRPIIYPEVTEYLGTKDNNIGKTIYTYDNYAWAASGMPAFTGQAIAKMHIYNWNYWNNPSLVSKTDYIRVVKPGGVIDYKPRKLVANSYNVISIDDVVGLHVQRLQVWPQTGVYYNQTVEKTMALSGANIYTYIDYHIPVGSKNLLSTSETLYNEDGTNTTTASSYTYNTKQYPSQTTRTKSDLGTVTSDIKYPFDYTGNAALTGMVSLNMLNYPVEQIEAENGTHLKSVRTNYYNWGGANPMYLPQTVDTRQGANAYETRLRYYSYDADGNPTSVSKENDVLHSYLWGYRNSYPVAEVVNAKSNEIFFDSFEEGGRWDGGLTAYDNTKSHSGFLSGRIDKSTAGEQVSVSNKWLTVALTAATKFKYSGWVFSNGPSAQLFLFMKRAGETGGNTYNDQVTTTTTGKWVYVEKEFMVPADVTQMTLRVDNNGGGSVWFDDLRLHPSVAKMSSFTYDLLRGIKSQADANNYHTYYEYDNYGRLKLVRDRDGNILKTFNYQYQSVNP